MLTNEINKIKKDFDSIISYSQGIFEPKTEELFQFWKKNKAKIISTFGNKLIYEFPKRVSLELNPKEKQDRLYGFIDELVNHWGCDELGDFIELQQKGFFDNVIVEDYQTYNGKIIKKGTKLIKTFKYFIPSERQLEDIQNAASRLIQENKIEGTLCLSVHPLDYLSSSETSYNWRSCHSLDGGYRAGNLSYMMDSSTIVCYLKGEADKILPNFPQDILWNSKKWRVLLFMSDDWDMIFAGRQYPFESKNGLDFILSQVLPEAGLIEENSYCFWSGWTKEKYSNFKVNGYQTKTPIYIPLGDGLKDIKELITDAPGSKHYDDLLYSNYYDPYYCFKCRRGIWKHEDSIPVTSMETTHFTIGNYTYCLNCGEAEVMESGGESMMCEQCELEIGDSQSEIFSYCDCCGNRMFTDDAILFNDEIYCEHCFHELTQQCECCGETVYKEDIKFDEDTNMYLCSDCFSEKTYGKEDY